ncbi:MAG: hypothetical protein ABIH89_10635 [Elusimicrobiota bacterium]
MDVSKLIEDTLVDVISGEYISPRVHGNSRYKKGFFLESPYINSRTTLKGGRALVNEAFLLDRIEKGEKRVKIPERAIITPQAQMLIDEGKVVIYE